MMKYKVLIVEDETILENIDVLRKVRFLDIGEEKLKQNLDAIIEDIVWNERSFLKEDENLLADIVWKDNLGCGL